MPVGRRIGLWLLPLVLVGCASRAGDGADPADAATTDAAATKTLVGAACKVDADCDGLFCATTFERACNGPIKPHPWSITLAGGTCNPKLDADKGEVVGTCPAGSRTLTLATGCDGIPFRVCLTVCASDADCRSAEGWFCEPEAKLCFPPALAK